MSDSPTFKWLEQNTDGIGIIDVGSGKVVAFVYGPPLHDPKLESEPYSVFEADTEEQALLAARAAVEKAQASSVR